VWTALVLFALVCLVFSLQLTLHFLAEAPLFWLIASTWSDVSNEYFSLAYTVSDPREFVRTYPDLMPQAQYHVATHPPGAVLVYWLGWQLFRRVPGLTSWLTTATENWLGLSLSLFRQNLLTIPAMPDLPEEAVPAALWCSLLLAFCGALTVVLVYRLGTLLRDRTTGLVAAGLFSTVPSLLFFFSTLDQLLLLLATTTLWGLVEGLVGKRWWASALAGGVWGGALFISFGMLPVGLWVLLMVALYGVTRRLSGREAVKHGVAFLSGMGGLWLGLALAWAWQPVATLRLGLAAHAQVNVGFQRTYGTWVGLNLLMFAVFLGLPLSVQVLRSGRDLPRLVREGDGIALLFAAALTTLLLLDLSGQVRAEVERIWLFLMPPFALWAARWLHERPAGEFRLTATLAFQLTQLLLMGLTLPPLVRPY